MARPNSAFPFPFESERRTTEAPGPSAVVPGLPVRRPHRRGPALVALLGGGAVVVCGLLAGPSSVGTGTAPVLQADSGPSVQRATELLRRSEPQVLSDSAWPRRATAVSAGRPLDRSATTSGAPLTVLASGGGSTDASSRPSAAGRGTAASGASPAAGASGASGASGTTKPPVAASREPAKAGSSTGSKATAPATESESTATTSKPAEATAAPKTGALSGNDFPTGKTITLRSSISNQYVTVEMNYTGNKDNMLRARSAGVGGWEQFTLVWVGSRRGWALRSTANALYVSAELEDGGGDTGMLRARSSTASDWELFDLWRFQDGTYGFKLKATGAFVAAELNYGTSDGVDRWGMLRARSSVVESWERFVLTG